MAEIDGYRIPSITDSLEQGMKDVNTGLRSLKPIRNQQPVVHTSPQPVPPPQPVVYQQPPQPPKQPDSTDKLRNWLLWLLVIIIGGGAAGLVIWRLILKF